VLGPDQVQETTVPPVYHSPLFAIDAQGSAGSSASPF
jgi:hypothetical protein